MSCVGGPELCRKQLAAAVADAVWNAVQDTVYMQDLLLHAALLVAHLFLISLRRAPHLRLPTNRFLTARLVRPGSSIEMAFQLLP